jgi:multicomponent Na+:H+ antiporter subunit F
MLLLFAALFLSVTAFLCLIYAIKGPKLADRIVATTMICIKVIVLIVVVSAYINEEHLVDVAFIYAMLSFLAIVVFTRFMLQFKLNKSMRAGNVSEKRAT